MASSLGMEKYSGLVAYDTVAPAVGALEVPAPTGAVAVDALDASRDNDPGQDEGSDKKDGLGLGYFHRMVDLWLGIVR